MVFTVSVFLSASELMIGTELVAVSLAERPLLSSTTMRPPRIQGRNDRKRVNAKNAGNATIRASDFRGEA